MLSLIRSCLLIIVFISFHHLSAQDIKEHVLKNMAPVNSIQISDTNYSDLEAFARAIGNRRIVLLGEQDHGDAPTFLAKARLVRFLHEKLGFEVIAFESDFYGLVKGWEAYQKGERKIDEVINEVFPIWTQCDAAADIFNYIRHTQQTSCPLQLTGFDNQIHGSYRIRNYRNDFNAGLAFSLPQDSAKHYANSLNNLLNLVHTNYPLSNNSRLPNDSLVNYTALLSNLQRSTNTLPDSSFFRMMVNSLRANIDQAIYSNDKSYHMMMKVRDEQMANNLAWLFQHYYPGKKIIVWAHNFHIARNTWSSMGNNTGRNYSMGSYLLPVLGKEMYVLGFTSYRGTAGRIYVNPFKVPKPKKASMENWFLSAKHPYAFVDLSSFQPKGRVEYYMKGKDHSNTMAVWHEVFDGVFYIKDMYPCKRIK